MIFPQAALSLSLCLVSSKAWDLIVSNFPNELCSQNKQKKKGNAKTNVINTTTVQHSVEQMINNKIIASSTGNIPGV